MDRNEHLLKYVTRSQSGIEIGPWFNPVASRRDGFNCLALDVFDTAELRDRAANNPNISHRAMEIEEVDLVGSSTEIDKIVERKYPLGSFDYIVSSHNFEHLANPIKFLQACARVLKPGGMVSMAIPDHRTCFDFFKPLTMLSDWMAAHADARDRPTPFQAFHHAAFFATIDEDGQRSGNFFRFSDVTKIGGPSDLDDVYARLVARIAHPDGEYVDAHCSTFTPSSFELLLIDCIYLGLVPYEIAEIVDMGCEFHAHLRVLAEPPRIDPDAHRLRRDRLMHRMKDDEAESSQLFRTTLAERDALKAEAAGQTGLPSLLAATMAERDALRVTVGQLKGSTSWRITAPLRWAAARARRLRA